MFTYGFQKYGSRPITYADRGTLPYVEATLLEIQRVANIGRFILVLKCCIPYCTIIVCSLN